MEKTNEIVNPRELTPEEFIWILDEWGYSQRYFLKHHKMGINYIYYRNVNFKLMPQKDVNLLEQFLGASDFEIAMKKVAEQRRLKAEKKQKRDPVPKTI